MSDSMRVVPALTEHHLAIHRVAPGIWVSTVELPFANHRGSRFETLVVGENADRFAHFGDSYSSHEEAWNGHQLVLDAVIRAWESEDEEPEPYRCNACGTLNVCDDCRGVCRDA